MPVDPACKMGAVTGAPSIPDEPGDTTAGIAAVDNPGGADQKSESANGLSAMKPECARQGVNAFVLEQIERMFNVVEDVFHRSQTTEGK